LEFIYWGSVYSRYLADSKKGKKKKQLLDPLGEIRIHGILITSGRFKERVKNSINDWNTKLHVPIEAFSGRQFAKLLS
jgi:hypothetical protein